MQAVCLAFVACDRKPYIFGNNPSDSHENHMEFYQRPEFLRPGFLRLSVVKTIHDDFHKKCIKAVEKPVGKPLSPYNKACETRLLNFGSIYIKQWNYRYLG
jgi:hypothetical protein